MLRHVLLLLAVVACAPSKTATSEPTTSRLDLTKLFPAPGLQTKARAEAARLKELQPHSEAERRINAQIVTLLEQVPARDASPREMQQFVASLFAIARELLDLAQGCEGKIHAVASLHFLAAQASASGVGAPEQVTEAIARTREVAAACPSSSRAQHQLGVVLLYSAEDKAGARAAFTRCLELEPSARDCEQARSWITH
jgi:hypothetical protein